MKIGEIGEIGEIGVIYIEIFLKIWYFCDPLDVYDSNINLVDNRWKPIFPLSNDDISMMIQ